MHWYDSVAIVSIFFFFNDTATTEIYTLSLHDALPICARRAQGQRRSRGGTPQPDGQRPGRRVRRGGGRGAGSDRQHQVAPRDRKSTRLNSSHSQISYAVFCLKKKTMNCNTLNVHSVMT